MRRSVPYDDDTGTDDGEYDVGERSPTSPTPEQRKAAARKAVTFNVTYAYFKRHYGF